MILMEKFGQGLQEMHSGDQEEAIKRIKNNQIYVPLHFFGETPMN